MERLTNRLLITKIIKPTYVILLFIFVFFGKNLIPANGNFIGGIDVASYFFWNAQFVKEQLLSGSIPLWNPYYYCGHPFIANPQTFIFYPFTLLYLVLSLPWAVNIDTLGHLYLAAMGAYCFVFIITQSKSAGLAAGTVYSFSGYFMDNIYAGHLTMLHTAALLPWIFYFIEKAYKTKRPYFLLISGLIFGLQILSGEPQNSYYTALFLTMYFFIRYFSTYQSFGRKPFKLFGVYFVLIFIVAFGISVIQILPSLEFMSLSDRAKNTYEFATYMSFPPQNFFTFLVPRPQTDLLNTFWELSGYLGILSIVLAVTGAVFSKQRQHTCCFGIMLFIAATIMLGRYTPIYQLYYKWLPGISTFRIPARCLVIFVFFMAALVGLGVQQLNESQLTRKRQLFTMTFLTILLLSLFGGAKVLGVPLVSKEILLATAFVISAFVILNVPRFMKNTRLVPVFLIVVLFLDLYFAYSHQTPKQNQNNLLQKYNFELLFERDSGFNRVNLPLVASRGMKFHYYNINGYTPIVLDDYFRFVHSMANLAEPQLDRHTLSLKLYQPDLVFSSKILGVKYAMVTAKTERELSLLVAPQVMPRAVLVRDAIVLPDLEEHLSYLKRPDFDPQRQVLLESAPRNNSSPISDTNDILGKDDIVEITQYQPNRINLKSISHSNTYLVLSELFYPGWHVYVDGRKAPILRADFLLRAVSLTPGRHDIVFVYRPVSFLAGAALSTLTILLLAGFWLIYFRKSG